MPRPFAWLALLRALVLVAAASIVLAGPACGAATGRGCSARCRPCHPRSDRREPQARGSVGPGAVRPRPEPQSPARRAPCQDRRSRAAPGPGRRAAQAAWAGAGAGRAAGERGAWPPSAPASTASSASSTPALKQARLLAARADELAEQITERRRSLYARQLFEQSPSVLSPFVWLDAAKAFAEELGALGELIKSAWQSLPRRRRPPARRAGGAHLGRARHRLAMLWRWWQRRIVAPVSAPTRFAKVLASIGAFLRVAVTGPLAALAVIEVLEAFQLLPDRWVEIAYGLGIAVAIAAFGRAIASGVFAPDAPWRRLVALDDERGAGVRAPSGLGRARDRRAAVRARPAQGAGRAAGARRRHQHAVCAGDRRPAAAPAARLASGTARRPPTRRRRARSGCGRSPGSSWP